MSAKVSSSKNPYMSLQLVSAIIWVFVSFASLTDPLRVYFAVVARVQPQFGYRLWDGAVEYTLPADYLTNQKDVFKKTITIKGGELNHAEFTLYTPKQKQPTHVWSFVGSLKLMNQTKPIELPTDMCMNEWTATEVVPVELVNKNSSYLESDEWFRCLIQTRSDGSFVPIQAQFDGDYWCKEMALWNFHDYELKKDHLFVPNPENYSEVLALVAHKDHRLAYNSNRPLSVFRSGGGGAMMNSKVMLNQKYMVFEAVEFQRCFKPIEWKNGHLKQFVYSQGNLSLIVDGYFDFFIRALIYVYVIYRRVQYVYIPVYQYVRHNGFPINGSFFPLHGGLRYGKEIYLLALEALLSLDEIVGTFLMLHEARTATWTQFIFLCSQSCKILWIPIALITMVSYCCKFVTGGKFGLKVSPDAYTLLIPLVVLYAGPNIVDSNKNLFQHYQQTSINSMGSMYVANSAKSSIGSTRTIYQLLEIVMPILVLCTLSLFFLSVIQQFSGIYLLIPGYRGNEYNLQHVGNATAVGVDLMLHEHGVAEDKYTQSLGLVLQGYERGVVVGFNEPILAWRGQPVLIVKQCDNEIGTFVIVVKNGIMQLKPIDAKNAKFQVSFYLPLEPQYTSKPMYDSSVSSCPDVAK